MNVSKRITTRRIAAAIGVAAIAASTFAAVSAHGAEQGRIAAAEAVQSAQYRVKAVQIETDYLTGEKANIEKQLAAAGEVLAKRQEFAKAVERVKKVSDSAVGKVVTAEWLGKVKDAQGKVITITDDPAKVTELTGVVVKQAEAIEKAVADYDAEQKRLAEERAAKERAAAQRTQSTGTGGNGSSRVTPPTASSNGGGGCGGDHIARGRAVLNSIGGSWVRLESFDGSCSGQNVQGCAYPGVIKLRPDTAGLGNARFNWIIVHEYAHQIQFNNWNAITSHPTYHSMFGGNIELLANCMASAWGYTAHGHYCSPAMINAARPVWNGGF